jgi:hypothetical protein
VTGVTKRPHRLCAARVSVQPMSTVSRPHAQRGRRIIRTTGAGNWT